MKKLGIVLAVISILALCQASQAADLQADWWVRISSIDIYSYDSTYHLPYIRGAASFLTAPGQYGPFLVSDGSLHRDYLRYITLPTGCTASSDQSLILPLYLGVDYPEIAYLGMSWSTSYDASQMRLEFWHQATDGTQDMIWSQNLSGTQYGGADLIRDSAAPGSYFLKVSIVPEPASITGLVFALTALAGLAKRRR